MTARSRAAAVLVLEGLPGAGKSTLARVLRDRWRRAGVRVGVVPEVLLLPARAEAGDFVRNDRSKAAMARALLTAGARLVVMDRWWVSTAAYTAASGRGLLDPSGAPGPSSVSTAVPTIWVFCELDTAARRRVGRPDELWDNDNFASRWSDIAWELMRDGPAHSVRLPVRTSTVPEVCIRLSRVLAEVR